MRQRARLPNGGKSGVYPWRIHITEAYALNPLTPTMCFALVRFSGSTEYYVLCEYATNFVQKPVLRSTHRLCSAKILTVDRGPSEESLVRIYKQGPCN